MKKLKIKSVKSLGLRTVCDISVANDESYLDINGIAHHNTTTNAEVKKMFVAPEGYLWYEIDYGQAELRVVAEMAKDEAMIDIFKKGYNIHMATACKMIGKLDFYEEAKAIEKNDDHPDNLFWKKQKKKGKVMNFSILYMQSDEATAIALGVSTEIARSFKQEWFNAFPRIKKWMDKQFKFVKENGFIVTPFGRKRRLPDVFSESRGFVNKALRDSINAPIQSASNDYTLASTIVVREETQRGNFPSYFQQIYTVHDSIGYLIKAEDVHWITEKIFKICENPQTKKYWNHEMTRVPMKMSCEVGFSWGELKEYDPRTDYVKVYNSHEKINTGGTN